MAFAYVAVTCARCDQWIVPNQAHTIWYHVWPEGAHGQWLAPENERRGYHLATPRYPASPHGPSGREQDNRR